MLNNVYEIRCKREQVVNFYDILDMEFDVMRIEQDVDTKEFMIVFKTNVFMYLWLKKEFNIRKRG